MFAESGDSKMQDIKITVITVCYNSEKTIERTFQSMLDQTYSNFEYIIVDGASTDSTMDIVRKYEPLFGGRMKVVSEPDRGIYDAMNKGIRLASGDMIGIVNSDDYYETNTLELVAEAYQGDDYTVIYGLLRQLKNGREFMVYSKNPAFIEEDMIAHPSCFVSRKLYEKFGGYSMEYPYSADYEFMLRIRNSQEIRYIELYDILSNFSIDGASSSIKAYRDTLRLQYQYGLINPVKYRVKMAKSWIALKMKG